MKKRDYIYNPREFRSGIKKGSAARTSKTVETAETPIDKAYRKGWWHGVLLGIAVGYILTKLA